MNKQKSAYKLCSTIINVDFKKFFKSHVTIIKQQLNDNFIAFTATSNPNNINMGGHQYLGVNLNYTKENIINYGKKGCFKSTLSEYEALQFNKFVIYKMYQQGYLLVYNQNLIYDRNCDMSQREIYINYQSVEGSLSNSENFKVLDRDGNDLCVRLKSSQKIIVDFRDLEFWKKIVGLEKIEQAMADFSEEHFELNDIFIRDRFSKDRLDTLNEVTNRLKSEMQNFYGPLRKFKDDSE